MNKEQYLAVRNNPEADTMPVIHFFYVSRGGYVKGFNQFNVLFGKWFKSLNPSAYWTLPVFVRHINEYVFKELDKYFKI